MNEKQLKILNRLQAQCVRREYCIADVTAKAVKALDGDKEAARAVVESLVAERFVDEVRYAAAFAREKAALTGWGPVKIRYALAAKGIPRDTVAQALEEIDDTAAGRKMETVLRTKYRTLAGDPQVRLKLLKFGLVRGYEYEDVRDRVDRIIREDSGEAIVFTPIKI